MPGDLPNQPFFRHQYIKRNLSQKRRNELISYNDCYYRFNLNYYFIIYYIFKIFFRHIYNYNYVLIIDIDEVVVPLKTLLWSTMLTNFFNEIKLKTTEYEFSSISVQNVFKFFDKKRRYSIFDVLNRSTIIQKPGFYGKSFMK